MGLSRPSNSVSQPAVTVPGAGGGGTPTQGVTATAGSDVQTTSNSNQSLTASASNGTAPYTYAWTLRTKPSGSSASITSPSSASATLTGIDTEGGFVCSVQATDAGGFTDTAQTTIDYAPAAVVSNAGSDVQTTSSSNQTLSGSGSGGTGTLTYSWALVTKPAGSTASITSATSATATLTGIDNAGAFVCALTVTDSAASAVSATDTVVIDYSTGAGAGGWTDIVNIDFTAASTQALTSGQENTIGSDVFWIDGFDAAGSIGITNGTGLEVSFKNQGGGHSGIYLKASGVAKVSNSQDWPRFRICAAISGIVYSANSDAIGCEATGYPPNGSTHYVPRITAQLKRNSGSSSVWKFSVRKGALGTTGTNVGASDVATSEPTSMVIELRERSGGNWDMCAEESTTTIPEAGAMTQVASAMQCHTVGRPAQYDYWAEGSNLSGPYLGVNFRGMSNGSQACVIEKLIIQQFL